MDVYRIDKLMAEARRLAADYRRATGRTLAISGEIAVADVIGLLRLEPAPDDAEGYDVIRRGAHGIERLQVKARLILDETRRPHRLGQLKSEQIWDAVLLVLMDENYDAIEILEADRSAIEAALAEVRPNRRGSLSVARFRNLGRLVWSREDGRLDAQ